MAFAPSFFQGATLLASAEIGSDQLAALADPADFADASAAFDWCVLVIGDTIHLHLATGAMLPAGLGQRSQLWELAGSLTGPLQTSLALATGPALDAAAVLTPLNAPAVTEAAALARLPVPALEDGPDAIWDRLSHAARRTQTLMREGRILAAALTFKGRGRLIGPLNGNLLLRFGVSAWR